MRTRVGIGLVVVLGVLVLGGAGVVLAQEPAEPPHENPDEVDDDGDLAELERWFGGKMGEMHVDCSEGMAVGDFDACEDLDEEYESYLERYVSVERGTTSDESERQGEEFEETRDEQRELAERLQEFNETRQEYEEARESGNDTRTRSRAREMQRQADRIEELGDNVSSGFRELDDSSSADLGRAADRTDETTAEAVQVARQAEGEALEPVELGVESDAEASFASPATVSGLVRTEDWEAVESGEVVVEDGAGFRAVAPVDEDGTWSASYRPTRAETGETTLNATYVPDDASPYMAANATATVTVAETNTTIEVENATDRAAYGENVTAVGTLSAAGERAANVSVAVRSRDEVIATGLTDEAGRFEVTGPLPATVPDGNVSLTVQGGESGTALAPSGESRSISVPSTGTTLSAAVEYDGDRAHVTGRLRTADGDPVGGRPVTLEVGEETRTVTTNAEGGYSVTVDRPSSEREAVLRYEELRGNLEGSRTNATIEPQTEGSFGSFGDLSEAIGAPGIEAVLRSLAADHPYLVAFLGVAVGLSVGVWVLVTWQWLRRRRGESATAETEGDERPESAVRRVTDDATGLSAARGQLERAPSTAVQLAFATVRSALGMDDSRTHWEVYRAAGDDLDGDRRESLRTVTEAFEAATFSPEGVDRERASAALEDAERCLSATDGGAGTDE